MNAEIRKKNILNTLSLLCNLAVFVLTVYSVTVTVINSTVGNMTVFKGALACLHYYTFDSNIVAALCCLVMFFANLRAYKSDDVKRGRPVFSRPVFVLKFIGTSLVAVTFMTVVCFLGPIAYSMSAMVEGVNLYLHVVNPLLCLVSFIFFERAERFPFRDCFIALIPTIIYGAVYAICVVFLEIWPDFYRFYIGKLWPVSALAMFGGAFIIAVIVRLCNRSFK